MICSVSLLDTASQAVRLLPGCVDDGMMNGNIDRPAVRMTPTTAHALPSSGSTVRRDPAARTTTSAPPKASSGATMANLKRV